MGMSCASVEIVIQEHLYRPLTGKVLLIGRQNTDITPQAMINLLELYGLTPRVPLLMEERGSLEHKTLTLSEDADRIADVSVFHALADVQVMALDISDYEGAEIIHDLNQPLPDKYKGQFDFIFDGSSLDNIFNVSQALISLSELLRPGGRLLLYNACNSSPTAYVQCSPDWVYDYFAVNHYADCKIYIHEFPWTFEKVVPENMPAGGYPIQNGCFWHFDPLVMYSGQYGFQNSEIKDEGQRFYHAIAEKAPHSTSTTAPVQMHYRGDNRAIYIEAARRFRESRRPIVFPRTGERFDEPSIGAWDVVYPLTRWTRRSYPPQKPSPHVNQKPAIGSGPDVSSANDDPVLDLRAELDEAMVQIKRLQEENRDRIRERDTLSAQRDEALLQAKRLEQEKEDRTKERDSVTSERDEIALQAQRLEQEKDDRIKERDTYLTELDRVRQTPVNRVMKKLSPRR